LSLDGIKITVMSGAEDGKVFGLEKTPIMLGRHPDDDVCLPYDSRVSRHHARITKEHDSYFIEDVGPKGKGSTNGTYVGDKKITTKTAISSGEMILLGSVWIRFEAKAIVLT
jgi:pSer/pThr/pTyr-binding forkhead associated (FHA) protein